MIIALYKVFTVFLVRVGGRIGKLSEEERIALGYIIAVGILLLIAWGLFVLIRYKFARQLIKRKMEWSLKNDPFWNYDSIIKLSQKAYVKAQLFLNTTPYESIPFLSPNAKARLRLMKKKIKGENDLLFHTSYIISFNDKKDNNADELKVYFEIKNKVTHRWYREMVVLKRNNEELVITDVIKNPTMFVISHARSLIEK